MVDWEGYIDGLHHIGVILFYWYIAEVTGCARKCQLRNCSLYVVELTCEQPASEMFFKWFVSSKEIHLDIFVLQGPMFNFVQWCLPSWISYQHKLLTLVGIIQWSFEYILGLMKFSVLSTNYIFIKVIT